MHECENPDEAWPQEATDAKALFETDVGCVSLVREHFPYDILHLIARHS